VSVSVRVCGCAYGCAHAYAYTFARECTRTCESGWVNVLYVDTIMNIGVKISGDDRQLTSLYLKVTFQLH